MTTARPSRSAGSTWSPIPAPISTAPFHRYADGEDLAGAPLESLADLPGIVVRQPVRDGLAIDAGATSTGSTSRARRCWSTPAGTGTGAPTPISSDHPFLTAAAADWLAEHGAALVGIDSYNIDDTQRPRAAGAHAACSAPDIPICEHMTGLDAAARQRLPLHRRAAQDRRHGDLPGPRLRS